MILVGKCLLTFTKASVHWNKLENTELMYIENRGCSRLAFSSAVLETGSSTDQWTEYPEHWEMAGPHPWVIPPSGQRPPTGLTPTG